MDRFVVREAKPGSAVGFPPGQSQQIVAYPQNTRANNMILESVYYENRNGDFPGMQHGGNVNGGGFMGIVHANASPYPQNGINFAMSPRNGQITSGIDPTYLDSYASNNAAYIVNADNSMTNQNVNPGFGGGYQNRNFVGAHRNKNVTFDPHVIVHEQSRSMSRQAQDNTIVRAKENNNIYGNPIGDAVRPRNPPQDFVNEQSRSMSRQAQDNTIVRAKENNNIYGNPIGDAVRPRNPPQNFVNEKIRSKFRQPEDNMIARVKENNIYGKPIGDAVRLRNTPQNFVNAVAVPKTEVVEEIKIVEQNQTKSRFDILKALHKTGPRAFSGPVEKVLKWHKALQDIGLLVIYEIVAKCVSVRPGESCAKHLVVRDDNGPAIQVVYYEIDFLLPEIKVPCTVRVIGRMLSGTCRLQAFNVRPATGDDVATLPRRAAVAAHHVAKLCKEYNINIH